MNLLGVYREGSDSVVVSEEVLLSVGICVQNHAEAGNVVNNLGGIISVEQVI